MRSSSIEEERGGARRKTTKRMKASGAAAVAVLIGALLVVVGTATPALAYHYSSSSVACTGASCQLTINTSGYGTGWEDGFADVKISGPASLALSAEPIVRSSDCTAVTITRLTPTSFRVNPGETGVCDVTLLETFAGGDGSSVTQEINSPSNNPPMDVSGDVEGSTLIDFEGVGLGCSDTVDTQYSDLGVTFSGGAEAFVDSGCLDSTAYPPHSPVTVIGEPLTGDGVVDVAFSPAAASVGSYITGSSAITLECYDSSDTLLGSDATSGNNRGDTGSFPPNELIEVAAPGIDHCLWHDSANYFTVDDVTVSYLGIGGTYWPMDEGSGTTTDSNPTGNLGTLGPTGFEPTWTTSDAPVFPSTSALEFSGSNYVSIPDAAELNPTEATFDEWVNFASKPSAAGHPMNLFSKSGQWWLHASDGSAGDGAADSIQAKVTVGGTRYVASTGANFIQTGIWYHVTGTYDGDTLKLFVNGLPQDENADPSGPIDTTTNPVAIGTWSASLGADSFVGTADEAQLYNWALSDGDVALLPQPPTAFSDTYGGGPTGTSVDAGHGVLHNDVDPDSIFSVPTAVLDTNVSHGTLTLNSDGSFDYTPNSGYVGSDSFTYHATDGSFFDMNEPTDSNTVTVTIDTSSLSLAPASEIDVKGTAHSVTATLSPAQAGVPITFAVYGANPSGYVIVDTNSLGRATLTYTGTHAGVDTIWAGTDNDGAWNWIPAGPVYKYWVDQYGQVNGTAKMNKKPYSLSGFLGQAGDAGPTVGTLSVVYPNGANCTFASTGSSTFTMATGNHSVTVTGLQSGSCGTATVVLNDKTLSPTRGGISIDSSNNTYDLFSGGSSTPVALTSGKVTIANLR